MQSLKFWGGSTFHLKNWAKVQLNFDNWGNYLSGANQ
jgi:hypothetical protein